MFDKDCEKLEKKVVKCIRLTLHNDVLFNVMEIESTPELRAKLEIIYMSWSLTNKLFFKKWLYSLKMMKGSRLLEHLNEFNRIVTQLLSLEIKLEEEDEALLFLSSLLPSYKHLIMTLMYGKDT